MLFAMNFECKSTFRGKWKWFWIISLTIWAKIEVTKHVLLADKFIPYRLEDICSLNAMKCVYVRFSPSKQQSFFSKVSLNSCLTGLDQLYTGRLPEEKAFNEILSIISRCVSRSVVITIRSGVQKVPTSTSGTICLSFLSLSLFFFFTFSFF